MENMRKQKRHRVGSPGQKEEKDDRHEYCACPTSCSNSVCNVTPPSLPPDALKWLNINTAKCLASLLVVAFLIYHGSKGSDSCKWLLSDGRFQGLSQGTQWQPSGCMMHKYTVNDIHTCMRYISYWGGRNYLVFLGDRRVRQLYYEFAALGDKHDPSEVEEPADKTIVKEDLKFKAEFLWRPEVDNSMGEAVQQLIKQKERPQYLIVGSATHSIQESHGNNKTQEEFKKNLAKLTGDFEELHRKDVKILWVLQDPVNETKLNITYRNTSSVTNKLVDLYNNAAYDILKDSNSVTIWSSYRLVAQGLSMYGGDHTSEDGLLAKPSATHLDVQILLNMHCNRHLLYQDSTCCASPEQQNLLQLLCAVFFIVCIALSVAVFVCTRHGSSQLTGDNKTAHKPSCTRVLLQLVGSFARLGLLLGYAFLCDRRNFFMKENKSFTLVNFFLPLSYVVVLGLSFIEESKEVGFFNKNHSSEMKGWMQLLILIYYFTGASQEVPIFMVVQCLVSAYLFISAYGHFTYFVTTGDFSISRFFKVLCRYNLLVFFLCFVMNRSYQFYYFVPLLSYWFIALYFTLAIWPQVTMKSIEENSSAVFYLILKLVLFAAFVTVLYMSEILFQKIFLFQMVKPLFIDQDNSVRDWMFHWNLHRYSALFGASFAYGVQLLKQHKLIDDVKPDSYLFKKDLGLLLIGLSGLGMLSYIIFLVVVVMYNGKAESTLVHPYISFIPIVSYVVFRNVHPLIRTNFSPLFSWFGSFSMELFISQYHIWLAADTHGTLVLIPGFPLLNVLATTFIFVCAAHEAHVLTIRLCDLLVPTDWRALLRNFLLFTIIIVPLAIHGGAFNFQQ